MTTIPRQLVQPGATSKQVGYALGRLIATARKNSINANQHEMKTDKKLGEIGAKVARETQIAIDGTTAVDLDSTKDEPSRTAFAAAVREEIFAGVNGMPSVEDIIDAWDRTKDLESGMEAVRDLMIAAFAKQASESQKALGMVIDLNLDLQNKADMWRDEFERIKALVLNRHEVFNSEIAGVCDRAMQDIRSKISLIDQREKVAEENADLQSKLAAEQSLVRTLEGERDDLHDKLAAAEKRLAEIAKLPERWKSYVSAETCITELRQALNPEPSAEEIERTEFEAAFPNLLKALTPSGMYASKKSQAMWESWQARASKEVKA